MILSTTMGCEKRVDFYQAQNTDEGLTGGGGNCGECPSSEENRMKIVRKNVITTPTAKFATSPAASPTEQWHRTEANGSITACQLAVKLVLAQYSGTKPQGLMTEGLKLTKRHVRNCFLKVALRLCNVEVDVTE